MVLARNNQKNTKNQKHKHTTAMGKNGNTPNKASQTVTTYHPRGDKRHENNKQGGNGDDEMSEEEENPLAIIQTDTSGSRSLTSSIGIGEFGMVATKKGNEATFCIAVKEQLFQKIKFLQGTSKFNLDPTSICGYLHLHCNVLEDAAPLWWEEHKGLLKKAHTDCRNNKIKSIKQQYYGKLISLQQYNTHEVNYSLSSPCQKLGLTRKMTR